MLDDGSSDDTPAVLASYPQDSFHWQSHANMGQSATMNKGWAMARGEVLAYLSADDVLDPDAVSVSVAYLNTHPEVLMIYGDYILIDEQSRELRRVDAPDFSYEEMVSEVVVQPGPGIFFRSNAFKKIGGWNPDYRQVPDLEYWLRLGLQGKIVHLPQVLAKFRVHSASQTYGEASIAKAEECVGVMEAYFARDDLPENICQLERRSKANAHLFVARMHLRAGRYGMTACSLFRAFAMDLRTMFAMHTVRMIGNGVKFRVGRFFSGSR